MVLTRYGLSHPSPSIRLPSMVFLDRVEGHPPKGKVDKGVEILVLGSSQLHTPTRKPTNRVGYLIMIVAQGCPTPSPRPGRTPRRRRWTPRTRALPPSARAAPRRGSTARRTRKTVFIAAPAATPAAIVLAIECLTTKWPSKSCMNTASSLIISFCPSHRDAVVSRQARASGTFSSDGCIAAVLDYLTKRTMRMVAPTRRSRTAQNSAYERATTLSSRKWTASQAPWPRRPTATRNAPSSGAT